MLDEKTVTLCYRYLGTFQIGPRKDYRDLLMRNYIKTSHQPTVDNPSISTATLVGLACHLIFLLAYIASVLLTHKSISKVLRDMLLCTVCLFSFQVNLSNQPIRIHH